MIFKFSAADITSTLMPELLVTSDVLNSTASLCLSQMSLVAPFKLDIKEEKKEEEEQLSIGTRNGFLIPIKTQISLLERLC